MNALTKKTMFSSGTVIYQPHRLQQSGSAPMADGGIEYIFEMESVGKETVAQVEDVENATPVNISSLW
jgi:hypothetical protein